MAKIERKIQKVFGETSGALGQFGSGQTGAKIINTDPDVIQALPAFLSGWSQAVLGGLRRPPLEEFNGLNYLNTRQIAYGHQEGIPEYSTGTTYYIGSIAKESGTTNLYGSITDDNIGNALTDIVNWKFLGNLTSLFVNEKTVVLDYAVLSSDNRILINATAGNIIITLPAITAAFKNKDPISLIRIDNTANTVTIIGTGGNYIDEGLTLDILLLSTKPFADNNNIWRAS